MQGSPDQDALLTPSEVAAMFRVNPKTVTRWARAGKISAKDLDRLIESLPAGMRLNVTGRVTVVPAGDSVEPKPVRRAAG